MKRILILALSILALSCAKTAEDGITFNVVQPLGQKSIYAVKNDLMMETDSPEKVGGASSMQGILSAVLESEVTARQPDGNWTLSSKFANINLQIDGETHEETSRRLEGKSFAVTIDNKGNIVGVMGVQDMIPGMDIRQMITQMAPSMMLPPKPVKVGESWPVEISNPTEVEGATVNQVLRGTGTLKEITNGLALMDFVYKLEMSMSGAETDRMRISGSGDGKSTVAYDLEKARFTTNTTTMTMRTTGQIGDGADVQEITTVLKSSLQVDLVNK